jgi:hypothetical protein
MASSSGMTWFLRAATISTPVNATAVPAAMRRPNGSWKMATPSAMVASGVIRVNGEIRFAS